MGLLDDAIRQHLELKRQHGAPEEELQRQEEEALGPARRDVAPAESAGDGEVELEAAADEAAPAEDLPAPADEAPPTDDAEAPAAPHEQETMLQEPPSEPEAIVESDSAAEREPLADERPSMPYDAAADMPDFGHEEDEPPAGEALAPESPAAPDAEEETPAGDAFADAPRGEPADADDEDLFAEHEEDVPEHEEDAPEHEQHPDDVLEDTPDFLQETPEHDRLWFEQKPPRDFDFD
jgi:hypothetical protein